MLLDDLSDQELADQIAYRESRLTVEIDCNYGQRVWCLWTPTRSGYYRLTATGAWQMRKHVSARRWLTESRRDTVNTFLDRLAPMDGLCPYTDGTNSERISDKDCMLEDLTEMGFASPREAGLMDDLSGLLPGPDDSGQLPGVDGMTAREWLYSEEAGENVRCDPRDLRVTCQGSSDSVNYTETKPIGILVHELRVSTVTPSR